ncbi:SDR family NAD(P)-dependent oxidoreductase [Actinospica durhamensis]|uniref:SDR family NAD(P)-dependent oxidoreductase n=1 Tax=Actinospica durhamensis TaxID=1508375 RepID=A0A941IRU3_9ACTN|nr:SDR family NAD(P)-dependent oxidoreductase [Actinospica durhamensis]MBR7834268.1 SDR family NAD(P)-dependent oxidoreductase [Actinospica durhamensis]
MSPTAHRIGRDLTAKSAVVTGAGSGIGRSIALLLAQRGARVYVADVDEQRAEAVARAIRGAGGAASAHVVDVTDADAVARFADAVFLDGPLDLLFNNAGIGLAGAVVDTTLEDWRRLIDVNLMGVVHGLNAFLPRLLAQGRPAHIVNTASMAGLVPAAGLTAYSATKAAVVALTEALEIELIGTAVRVSALCPGVIDTAIVSATTMRGTWADRRARTVELYAKRGTSPDTVARQALAALRRGRRIVPTPRYQVVPHWWLKRTVPPAGRALSILSFRFLSRDD